MRIVSATCIILLLVCTAGALGEEADPPPLSLNKTNISRLRWLQYSLIAGKLVASGTNMTFGPANFGGRQRERLEIRVASGTVDLRYELSGPDEQFSITLAESNQLSLKRTRPKAQYQLEFEQPASGPLVLTLTEGDTKRMLRGESFWHVYLADPELVRRHLVPLLELLRASWQLASLGSTIEDALVQRAPHLRSGDQQRWTQWIEELASPRFAQRENAQRELYKAGQAILPFLEQLDRDHLDAEQVARIRTLVESLSAGYEDTTDRIATWLAGDPQAWLSLLARDELVKRRVAAEQLTLILGEPIDFDPAADEPTRALQIERLRTRLQKPTVR